MQPSRWIRFFDVVCAFTALTLGAPLLAVLGIVVWCESGAPLFRQQRVGLNGQPFTLVKFRTMRLGTASVATHLADPTATTQLGRFLRRSKLDELPQLWNVLTGDMSLVGPRPCLPTQHALLAERSSRGVLDHRPGITGLAQIKGIDMSTPELLARTDAQMLAQFTLRTYFYYILITALGKGAGDRLRNRN